LLGQQNTRRVLLAWSLTRTNHGVPCRLSTLALLGRQESGRRPTPAMRWLHCTCTAWAASSSTPINTRTPDLILDLAVAAGGVAERKDDHKLLHHRPSAGWLLASWGSYPTASAPSILRRPPAMASPRIRTAGVLGLPVAGAACART
jgi:hypothetical protein